MIKNILITGIPKSGKSTLVRKMIAIQPNKVGFITNEINDDEGRVGFEIETHKGTKSVLAHTNFSTPHQISKYFVNIKNLYKILPEVSKFSKNDLLYLDEVGQMQLFSVDFKELVQKYLDAENLLIATLSAVHHDRFTDSIRARKDVYIVEISDVNREEKMEFIKQLITKIEKAKYYVTQPDRFIREGNDLELKSEHGTRILKKIGIEWGCSCDFFLTFKVCSHVMAAEEVYGQQKNQTN